MESRPNMNKSFSIATTLSVVLIIWTANININKWYVPSAEIIQDHIIRPLKHINNLPEEHRWDNINDRNYLTLIRTERAPQYCGACWAHSAASSISDRINIMQNGKNADVIISPQLFLSWSENDNGCHGGDPLSAFKYGFNNNFTDETWTIYQGRGHTNGLKWSPSMKCRSWFAGELWHIPNRYPVYQIEEFGRVKGEENMKQEIFQRGPIVCNIVITDEFKNYTNGILEDSTGAQSITHSVSIVGYGVENGTKYWHVRNSWGQYWGEEGFFRIVRGKNNLMIESDCSFAVPKDTWTSQVYHYTTQEEIDDPRNDFSNGPYFINELAQEYLENRTLGGVNVPEIFYKTDVKDLPKHWDWRNVDGRNFLSWMKNQHSPIYWGCCWAQSSTSALADRFNILNWRINNNTKAKVTSLSTQVVVNCHMGGSCWGGNPVAVYQKLRRTPIPEDSCTPYVSRNIKTFEIVKWEPIHVCKQCEGPAPNANETGDENCKAVNEYRKHYTKGYNLIAGVDDIKKEICK